MALHGEVETRGKGRAAVATAGIPAGTCLLRTPAVAVASTQACNWCLTAPSGLGAGGLQRCGGCRQVRYCSRRCQQDDWSRGAHGRECGSWRHIPAGAATPTVLLVTRLAARLRLAGNDLDDKEEGGSTPIPEDEILALCHHYEKHTPDQRRRYDEMTDLVLLLLQRSKHNARGLSLAALRAAHAHEIRLLFGRVNCNAFTICDGINRPVGIGLFPAAALLNHSCDPNCVVSFELPGQTLRIQVVRAVEPGEELTISYLELFASTATRQRELAASYFFDCSCARCLRSQAADGTLEDAAMDGYCCHAPECKRDIGAVVVLEGDDTARCRVCGAQRPAATIRHHDLLLGEVLSQAARPVAAARDKWRLYMEAWRLATEELRLHPRNSRLGSLARTIGNFVIDHEDELGDDGGGRVAIDFLLRELGAIESILPSTPLPTRGLLHFQLAKLFHAEAQDDQARTHLRSALAMYVMT